MSSSRNHSKNKTTTVDERTTQTINAGIGGNIGEGSGVISGNYGDTVMVHMNTDGGAFDLVADAGYEAFSFARDAVDAVGYAASDALDFGGDALAAVEYTAGGAFDFVENIGLGLLDLLGESQKATLGAANDLAARSLDGAMSIKAGQTITEPANQTIREVAKTGAWIVGIAGAAYVASKAVGGKK